MKNEHVILKSASSRVTLSVARSVPPRVTLSVAKGLAFLFALMLSLTACSDYEADYEDMYGYLVDASTIIPGSSSSVIPSSSSGVILSSSSEGSSIKDGSKYDASAKTLTDLRDGQVYKTVTIGTQTWMAENLNYDPGNVSSMGSYAWQGCYDNSAANCATYGRLYTWEVAMDKAGCGYGNYCENKYEGTQGVCPEGWHLPSEEEWNTLFTAVGGFSTAGTKLKSISGWTSNGNGTDAFGFAALPAGVGDYDGASFYKGDYAYFWSSEEGTNRNAFYMCLIYYDEYAFLSYNGKSSARSVRCLKD